MKTPAAEYMQEQEKKGRVLNLDTFGEIMDEFIEKNECMMLITMPEGSQTPIIKENMGIGPVGALYFLFAAIPVIFGDMVRALEISGDRTEIEKLSDGILDLVRRDMIEAAED